MSFRSLWYSFVAVMALVVAVGCTMDVEDPQTVNCSAANPECPEGQVCNGTICVPAGTKLDVGTKTDGQISPDGPVVDAPWPDAPAPDTMTPDTLQPDGPVADLPWVDGPVADTIATPDSPVPDTGLDATTADGACSTGAQQPCYNGPSGTQSVGICKAGIQTCTGGTWGVCVGEITPAATDTCDGFDNDCNGQPDDPFDCAQGATTSCTTTCATTGTKTCGPACTWSACQPPAEICNGADDDCDGAPDNGFACVKGTAGIPCTASCGTTGSAQCASDCTLGSCKPPNESCNGIDDDCDGVKDDGYACVKGTSQSCSTSCGSKGTQSCGNSCTWGTCVPPAEKCNGLDDDCDGAKDEDFACVQNTTTSCTTSCGTTGKLSCSSTCTGACKPPEETCNGVDDDCDGKKDNGPGMECSPKVCRSCVCTMCLKCQPGESYMEKCDSTCKWGKCVCTSPLSCLK